MQTTYGSSYLPDFAVRALALSTIERSTQNGYEVGALSVVNASPALWCACIDALDRCADVESGLGRRIYCSHLSLDEFLEPGSAIDDGLVIVGVDEQGTFEAGTHLFEAIRCLLKREFLHVVPLFETETLMKKFLAYCFPLIPICLLEDASNEDLELLISALLMHETGQISKLEENAVALQ